MKAYARDEKAFLHQVEKQTMASIKANKEEAIGDLLLMLYCFNYFNDDPAQIELTIVSPEENTKWLLWAVVEEGTDPGESDRQTVTGHFSASDRNGNIHSTAIYVRIKMRLTDFWASCGVALAGGKFLI